MTAAGDGHLRQVPCLVCRGRGTVIASDETLRVREARCPECDGWGVVVLETVS